MIFISWRKFRQPTSESQKRYLLKEYALKEALNGRPEGTSADGKTLAGPQGALADGKAAAGPQGALAGGKEATGSQRTSAGGTEAASPQEMERADSLGGSAQEALDGAQAVRDAAQVERTVFNIVKAASKHEGELTGLEDFKDDLGMDSLSIMEMCTEIESEFSVSVGAFITVIPNARELTDYVLDPIFENLVTQKKEPDEKGKCLSLSCEKETGSQGTVFILQGMEQAQPRL